MTNQITATFDITADFYNQLLNDAFVQQLCTTENSVRTYLSSYNESFIQKTCTNGTDTSVDFSVWIHDDSTCWVIFRTNQESVLQTVYELGNVGGNSYQDHLDREALMRAIVAEVRTARAKSTKTN